MMGEIDMGPPAAADTVREMYTYEEFASLLSISKDTLYRWVREGRIPSPVYLPSARFAADVVSLVQRQGAQRPGTFMRAESDRSAVGRMGAEARSAARSKKKKKPKHVTHVVHQRKGQHTASDAIAAKKRRAK